jgi:glycosyltransferase involved in cell wall biosynthesis
LLEKNNPILAAKCMVVPHGTLSLFAQLESGHVVREPLNCLFFGRMEKYRGLDNLVRIGRILKERLSGIRIVVAGTGTELPKYKSELIATGIFEIHDSFIPDREIYRFFKRSSLLLLPYNEASQSGVIMMGLSFGLPVVATKVGAIPEIIVDGQHGRVLPVGDFHGFAEAVHQMLTNEVVRQKMANACIKLGEALSFQNLAGRFESMYAQVVTALSKR